MASQKVIDQLKRVHRDMEESTNKFILQDAIKDLENEGSNNKSYFDNNPNPTGVLTPDDIKQFIGRASYDNHGQLIFRGADKDNLQQFLDVRGWGSIQHMFKSEQDAANFQDKVGRWVTDVINNNLR
jgi:hypothetical protein